MTKKNTLPEQEQKVIRILIKYVGIKKKNVIHSTNDERLLQVPYQ